MPNPNNSKTDLALQLFTVHEELNKDPINTLDWISMIGFKSVELAGFGFLGAQKFASELRSRQLSCVGIHGPCVEAYVGKNLNDLVSWCERMRNIFKCNIIVIFRNPETFLYNDMSPDLAKKYYIHLASQINEFNNCLLKTEIKLVYHCFHIDLIPFNHEVSHEQLCGLQVLLDNIKSYNFTLQLDTFFLVTAGTVSDTTSISLAGMAEGRVSSVHVNDIYQNGFSATMGRGYRHLSELVKKIDCTNRCVRWILELDPRIGDISTRRQSIINSKEYWEQNAPLWLSKWR